MPNIPEQPLLDALLDSWDRNNTILLNLLRVIPENALQLKPIESSPSIAQLFTHIHYVRLVFVVEDAPEFAIEIPEREWASEGDRDHIARLLYDSSRAVRDAVMRRIEADRAMNVHYDHPVLMLQHMLWHEGYHHGQIKLSLKLAGLAIADQVAGPLTWGIWMKKRHPDAAPVIAPAS